MSEERVLPELGEVWQQSLNWQPTQSEQERFQRLYALVLEGNRQFNLTRITEPIEFWEKHLWDSLAGIRAWFSRSNDTSFRSIDIGTGAGFPGLPIALVCPGWSVTLLDSTRKKIAFLDGLLETLGVTNALTLCDRVEQLGRTEYRETYDLALVRAVASAAVCAEYALPLLKVGGCAVLYRGQWTAEEATGLEQAVQILGGEIASVESFETPISLSIRHCLQIKKTSATPDDFPRSIGIAVQNPL